jgi:hypothetical protein
MNAVPKPTIDFRASHFRVVHLAKISRAVLKNAAAASAAQHWKVS